MAGRSCSSRSGARPGAGHLYTGSMDCPCGNPMPFEACCRPLLQGDRAPETAEALMRSRYSAYATGEVDYIIESQSPGTTRSEGMP